MLELIDQHDPERILFRCASCLFQGISSHAQARDGFFLNSTERPAKWVLHRYNPNAVGPSMGECPGVKVEPAPTPPRVKKVAPPRKPRAKKAAAPGA